MQAVVEGCGRDATPALIARLVTIERDFLAADVRLYPDSLDTLRWLHDAGVPTALVSNCSPATGAVVERLGLAAELDVVVLSFEVGAQKPAPEIFQVALDGLGTGPSDAWFIDDQVAYCDGACDSVSRRCASPDPAGPPAPRCARTATIPSSGRSSRRAPISGFGTGEDPDRVATTTGGAGCPSTGERRAGGGAQPQGARAGRSGRSRRP